MIIDLSPIFNGKCGNERYVDSFNLQVSYIEHVGALSCSPVEVTANIGKVGDDICIDCNYRCEMTFICSRCVEDVLFPISEKFEIKLSGEELEDLKDSNILDKQMLNMDLLISDELIEHLPSKVLCAQTCKGLCTECGKNLNVGGCDCEIDNIDPRFKILEGLFSE